MPEETSIAGLSIGLDPSLFLGGSAEVQDEIEKLLASFIHASREGDKTVEALAKSLSASPKEVAKALREMDKQDAQANRAAQRQQALAQKQAQARHREEMRMIKERGVALSNLRDSLLSIASITIGGAGLAGAYNAVKSTAQEGVDESTFATRTGTNYRQNVAEEEGASISGMATKEEARSSISVWANAREKMRNDGELHDLYKNLLRGVNLNTFTTIKNHADAVQYAISSMRHYGLTNADIAYRLEKSGLTSGGYTAFALDTKKFRESNAKGYENTQDMNEAEDLKTAAEIGNLESQTRHLRRTISRDLNPFVHELSGLVVSLDELAQKNPDMVKDAALLAAGVTGLSAAFMALTPVLKVLNTLRSLGLIVIRSAVGSSAAIAGGVGWVAEQAREETGHSPWDDRYGGYTPFSPHVEEIKGTTEKESHISDEDAKKHYETRSGDPKWASLVLETLSPLTREDLDRERTLMERERQQGKTNSHSSISSDKAAPPQSLPTAKQPDAQSAPKTPSPQPLPDQNAQPANTPRQPQESIPPPSPTMQDPSQAPPNAQPISFDPKDIDRLTGAVAMTESGGDPLARSGKGAEGLLQFMPATAKQYGVKDPYNPQQAWQGGQHMLLDLLKYYHNDLEKALAAYNWGLGNVNHVVKKYGVSWKDHLRKETKDYIPRAENNLRTNHLVQRPMMGAEMATSRPHIAHHHNRSEVAMTIQNLTVRANNPQQFQQQMQRVASTSMRHPTSWNSNQL
ncbi:MULTISPECIES: lytic transglycosylase domain-containing protein [unclassified Saccharibacter]|uniref:lytic transglycosylase domain-containing protein n=1 Tax=unclassified Saccharibacter TaxID=2648722 RepID=UPI00132C9D89|nr:MULTISPECIES: lytic transglycosylase domain-containing protein [unclassified Saccharibacter]MXV35670.1 transglycosylase SLT domain-containing protein [Saccharibacter sp. EH611]MXV58284.1 transglycosylase SLT domain-containing protein [Saccharibacter sp. EH70]MXV66419.1 transglycosylase SLT domain-containing protein [Saccharibacter sp. EH60]